MTKHEKSAGHRSMGAGAPRLFGLLNPAAGFRAAGEWCYGERVASNDSGVLRSMKAIGQKRTPSLESENSALTRIFLTAQERA